MGQNVSKTQLQPQPTSTHSNHERMLAPDLGRGFMLLLIVIAHAPLFLFNAEPVVFSRPLGVNWLDHLVNFMGIVFVDNRAFPMFAVLFGYGLAFMVKRQLSKGVPEDQVKRLLRRRSWFLIAFGFFHFVVIGGADILGLYGFSGLLIGWLLFKSGKVTLRTLFGVSLFYFIVIPLSWAAMITTADGTGLDASLRPDHTYAGLVLEHTMAFPFVILFQLILYPMLLVILVGVWLAGKRWLEQPDQYRSPLRKIAVYGTGISIVGAIPLALAGVDLWNPSLEWLSAAVILHIFTGLAGGFGYTAFFALFSISARQKVPKITRLLAATGKRSLTFYLYQEAMLVIILSPVAFGVGGMLSSTGVFVVAILIWLTALLLGGILEKKGLPGPADWWLRKLVYRTK